MKAPLPNGNSDNLGMKEERVPRAGEKDLKYDSPLGSEKMIEWPFLDEKMQLMGESVLAAFGEPGLPLLERLRNGIERHFDFIAANPDLPRFIVNEVLMHPDRYELMRQGIERLTSVMFSEVQQALDESAARGLTESVDARMLLLDIISLNIFPFIAYPILEPILGDLTADREFFFRLRRQETIEAIMRRIQKH